MIYIEVGRDSRQVFDSADMGERCKLGRKPLEMRADEIEVFVAMW